MVGVVLVHPPAEAQPDEHVSHREAEQAVVSACAEHLVVPRIMAEEAELSEGESRQNGDGEGRPRVADDNEHGPCGQEGEDRQGDLQPVVTGPSVKETHRSHLIRQRTKASRRRVDCRRRPVCDRGPAGRRSKIAGYCHLRRSRFPGASSAHRSVASPPGLEQRCRGPGLTGTDRGYSLRRYHQETARLRHADGLRAHRRLPGPPGPVRPGRGADGLDHGWPPPAGADAKETGHAS